MQIFTVVIIGITSLLSIAGFSNKSIYEKSIFSVGEILGNKQIYRLLTSQFFHVDWTHLLFNMFSLYSFSANLEAKLGAAIVASIYIGSGIGGDIFALILKRKNYSYRAVGASGAVIGIIFSSIFLVPGGSIIIFPLPIPLPAWLFAIIFILATIFGIGRRTSDIGHEAHLGGAITGILISIFINPNIIFENYILLGGIVTTVIVSLVIISRMSKKTS